jgi:hypothetical protein
MLTGIEFNVYTSENQVSSQNICYQDPSKLLEISLKDLKTWEIQPNTILWLKTITGPCYIDCVEFVVEDKNGDFSPVGLYNQVDRATSYQGLLEVFPKGTEMGIKQPYLQVAYGGIVTIRNDNPENVVFRYAKTNLMDSKNL